MRIITIHYENAFRSKVEQRSSFCGPIVALHIVDVIPSFKRTLPRDTVCAGCATSIDVALGSGVASNR